jgi:hypothetical protein
VVRIPLIVDSSDKPMTHFLRDILRQPEELQGVIDFLCGGGGSILDEAAKAVRVMAVR